MHGKLDVWTFSLPLPTFALWPICLIKDIASKITGKPNMLSRQKYRELKAAGWVCSVDKIKEELGFVADTTLEDGITKTIEWYRENEWL